MGPTPRTIGPRALSSVHQVGGIKPGCFKIGNTGGMMDNIIASKLYRPGSIGYVSKSGGTSGWRLSTGARTVAEAPH